MNSVLVEVFRAGTPPTWYDSFVWFLFEERFQSFVDNGRMR